MTREAFQRERASILGNLQRTFAAAEARVAAVASQEEAVARAAFTQAKAALEASARRNGMTGVMVAEGMGDPNRVVFEVSLKGKTWRAV